MMYVTLSNILCLLGHTSPFILIQFGWLVSWAYLRFYQANEAGARGDRSDSFALVQWFPPFMHRPVGFIGATVHRIANALRLVPRWDDAGGYSDVELDMPAPRIQVHGANSTRAEAERRRTMALEALDQRLASGKGGAERSDEADAGASISASDSKEEK